MSTEDDLFYGVSMRINVRNAKQYEHFLGLMYKVYPKMSWSGLIRDPETMQVSHFYVNFAGSRDYRENFYPTK